MQNAIGPACMLPSQLILKTHFWLEVPLK